MKFSCSNPSEYGKLIELSNHVLSSILTLSGGLNQSPESIEQLILSDFWPRAVPESLIVRTPEAALYRSRAVINSFVGDLSGKKFLDFGCGDGLCVKSAINADLAIGYDIVQHRDWDHNNLTTDFENVMKYGKYDKILLYDVFDHVDECAVPTVMSQIREVADEHTIFHIRCHPWTSIHGGHLYLNLNKAFAHLFLTDEQISKYQTDKVRKIIRPLKTYTETWQNYGFQTVDMVVKKRTLANDVGDFFDSPDVVDFLQHRSPQKLDADHEWQQSVLPIEFVDFKLKLA